MPRPAVARARMSTVRIAAGTTLDGGGVLRPLAEDGTPAGPEERVDDLVRAIGARERADSPRWVWSATGRIYPRLLAAGVRVARCHDLELVEALVLSHEGRYGQPRSVRAALARLRGEPVPGDAAPADGGQPTLFGGAEDTADEMAALIAVHADQRRRIAATEHPERLGLLAAAESAGGLIAAEMTHEGLPWSATRHDALLTELLGPRPGPGLRPRRLQELADRIAQEFGGRRPVNPDSPAQLVKAFAAEGVIVPSTRSHVLRRVDHPAVPLLLEYKELARLHTAHGWSWLDSWVRQGRFRPEYVVGGVPSGRWATRGGGALQIPRVLRRAVVADPGWTLVVADAAQLEPRVLAALAGDRAFAAAAAKGDLYAALSDAFGTGDDARDKAKIALLSAMYGGGTGEAVQLLAVLRNRFPDAFGYVEAAARAGEAGRLVRSRLGRTCPPPSAAWRDLTSDGFAGQDETRAGAALRSRGRFTRNFVVQASAADWALALMALLRGRLDGLVQKDDRRDVPHLVFFQHDEVIVHARKELADEVAEAIRAAAAEAGRLLFGRTQVVFPMEIAAVDCYADAK
ncbi:bifunctional 3'-5' exonuclease/DNA polymerase [Actinomadura sp. HBU206391]|uniref:bifunctional 3'-5' exonuclease/DNA polymerase n=1 Tax=Actinomadura sp. HBU206391 TaxID=2731692 RepID=UPI001650CF84|nr:bifunctional 3'-5' exonuclease/DNA polymerase [Actinomadura sp. HBU206391]